MSRSAPAADSAERNGLAPLPRRVPQTSLAAELRDEDLGGRGGRNGSSDDWADFTAERAASSLAGFQRGSLRAQADDDAHDGTDDGMNGTHLGPDPAGPPAHPDHDAGPTPGDNSDSDGQVLSSAAPSTPPADRRSPTKDSR
ncbi:hypothetical protein Q3A86_28155 [Streptomyces sp. NBUA17]|uniref:hypothetical protein n=1 Tax=Streptomyces sp. NBUA17 TaxID=3062275 RepID=UPI0037D9E21E